MNKITTVDKTVLRETRYIAVWTVILSAMMQAVFLIIGKWDYTVLLGNLLTAVTCVVNFFLLGITVQKAVVNEEKDAKSLMRWSQSMRMLLLLVVLAVGAALPKVFNIWATIIPIFFTRIALLFRPRFGKMDDGVSATDQRADTSKENGGDGGDDPQDHRE